MSIMVKYIKYITLPILALLLFACSEDRIDGSAKGTLTGIVVVNGTNEPLENVKISTNPSSSTVFTDSEGNFVIEDIAAEQYSVQAELEGFLPAFEAADITGGSTVNVVFELDIETANNRPPNTPVLVTPTNNATDVELQTQLNWIGSDPDEDDITYSIEIRNNFDDELLSFSTENDTFIDVSGLRFGLKYFWQVGAKDPINEEEIQSEVGVFETLSSPNNRVVFVRSINGNNVIFSSDEQGENELQLTDETVNSFRPRRNIAANRIAFLSNTGSGTHIFTMDLDGSNKTQVTAQVQVNGFDLNEIDYAWNQSGSTLYYPNFNRLYTINIDGTGLQQIYQTADASFITEVSVSADESLIALKTNDVSGYNVAIFTINNAGIVLDVILSGVQGAAGGIDISVDNQSVLYWYDVSGFQSPNYRQLDSRVFIYNRPTQVTEDLSDNKVAGTNDFDCRFTPNEAEVILTNTSNDGISIKNLFIIDINSNSNTVSRNLFIQNAEMPDFE